MIELSKICPKCKKTLPETAKFCMHCGHEFSDAAKNENNSNIFSNGKIFIVLIIAVLIIGGLFILTSGDNSNSEPVDDVDHVDLTITDVLGYDSSSGKKSYTLYTEALFNHVPDDLEGYNVKTMYVDDNDTLIGQEIEKLDYVYYDTDYSISFGHYTTYQKPNPDHVNVEIIKDGQIVDNYTYKIDQGKIDYLN